MTLKAILGIGAAVAAAAAVVTVTVLLVAGGDDTGSTTDTDPSAATGTIIIEQQTEPAGQSGSFHFTGVPSGFVSGDSTLVVSDLAPGTYTTTERNPAPDFDVTAAECSDSEDGLASSADPQTRTAVVNLDPGETVRCTFTNTQRGSLVIAGRTEPDGAGGSFQFTGVPTGIIPSNGTLVVANLSPGTYSSTERDPAPEFDLTAVECDDGASPTASSGDPSSRTAIFNLDPGEMVTCTFTNTRRGAAIIAADLSSEDASGSFLFTGVPSGTIPGNGTLVVANLSPGTYSSTLADPAPEFELTAVECDDGTSGLPSAGDTSTRTAIFNIDPGETVTCLYTLGEPDDEDDDIVAGGTTGGSTGGTGGEGVPDGGVNPFQEPDEDFELFPQPEDVPADAGTYAAPRPGPWTAFNLTGQIDCGVTGFAIPASPPESGTLEVLDGGATVIGSAGLAAPPSEEEQVSVGDSITLNAIPGITGRYSGALEFSFEGSEIVINYFWQVVTDEYIVGYLTSNFSSEGVSCSIYRPYELRFSG